MARTLRGEVRPTMAAAFPPLAINIERQATREPHLAALYALADEMKQQPGVLTDSIMLGFPYADVEEMGSSAIVVTDGDADLAQRLAGELGAALWSRREDFVGQLVEIDDALNRAAELAGPVCLLDMGDNVGGGSPADGTILAHEIVRRSIGPAFVSLYDPDAVQQAVSAGVGAAVNLQLGGKTDNQHGQPLAGEFTVMSLHDGQFTESQPRHGGMVSFDQGTTAIVKAASGLTVMLTSRRMPPFSLNQLTSCGLDPASFQILVTKGVHAPIAAYAPVCKNLIRVNTPGCTSADLESLEFRHRRRPMFPFERDTTWSDCS
jgi:microcystin degradation protein MlrC